MSKTTSKNTSLYLSVGFIVLLLGTGIFLGVMGKSASRQSPQPTTKPNIQFGKVSLEGRMTCLPGKPGPDGSMTLGCAMGFLSDEGNYYTLADPANENNSEWFQSPLYTAEKVRIEGTLSEETSDKFDIIGKITLESFTVLEPAEED